jgi:hypothetical protein
VAMHLKARLTASHNHNLFSGPQPVGLTAAAHPVAHTQSTIWPVGKRFLAVCCKQAGDQCHRFRPRYAYHAQRPAARR